MAAPSRPRDGAGPTGQCFTIVHFNDVYDVEEAKNQPLPGGAARFVTAVERYKHLNPMVVFSGDIFNPSLLSTFARGEHMIPVLNRLEVHVAVFGNHDFDFGLDCCMALTAETSFPWLLSNVRNKETKRPLAEGKITYITRWNGIKIGFMGLVEYEWLETLSTVNADEVQYIDYVEMGNKLSTKLRHEQGCDMVVALTHMRTHNDLRLLEEGHDIDLILGGHDHDYELHSNDRCTLVKSGTDFREFSVIDVARSDSGLWSFNVERVEVTPDIDEDAKMKAELKPFIDMSQSRLDDVIAYFEVDLEGRFSKMRSEETNLGNFCCDVIMAAMNADCVVLNSGTLRSDRIHPAGDFTMRDLVTIAPFIDGLVLLEVSGDVLHQTLENAVSMYPLLVGRFPQVAGLSFVFDPEKEPGHRVDIRYVKVADKFLEPSTMYHLAAKEYIYQGKDGFTCLSAARLLHDSESSPNLRTAIINHFDTINRLKGFMGPPAALSQHRQSIVAISRRNSRLRSTMDHAGLKRPESTCTRRGSLSVISVPGETLTRRQSSFAAAALLSSQHIMDKLYTSGEDSEGVSDCQSQYERRMSVASHEGPATIQMALEMEEMEIEAARLAPHIEGRIRIATPEILAELEQQRRHSQLQTPVYPEEEEDDVFDQNVPQIHEPDDQQ